MQLWGNAVHEPQHAPVVAEHRRGEGFDAVLRGGQRQPAQQTLTDASQKIYDLATARYKNGIDSYLNVLDAQRSYYSAQQGLIAIQLVRLVNLVNMYRVLGGGGQLEQEKP